MGLSAGALSLGISLVCPVSSPPPHLPGGQEEVLASSQGKQALQVPGGLPEGTDSCHTLKILQMLSAPRRKLHGPAAF